MSILGKCTAFSLVSCAPGSSPRVWRHWCPKPMQKGFSSCRRLSRGDMVRKMLSMLSMDHLNVGYPNLDPYTCAVRDFDFGSSSSNCIWLVVASKNFIFHPNKGNENHKWLKKRSCDGANICNPYTYIQWYPIISDFGTCNIYIYICIHMHIYTYIYRCPSKRRDDVVFARPWCNGIQIAAVLRQRFFITRILRHQQGDEVKDP